MRPLPLPRIPFYYCLFDEILLILKAQFKCHFPFHLSPIFLLSGQNESLALLGSCRNVHLWNPEKLLGESSVEFAIFTFKT